MARTGFRSPLYVDDDSFYLGTSLGADGKGRLHNFVANTANEPIHVNVVNTIGSDLEAENKFAAISSVLPNVETLVTSYTVPAGKKLYLDRIDLSGTNIATYRVYLDGEVIATTRTYFAGSLFTSIDFGSLNKPILIESESVLEVKVIHSRPSSGDFETRIYGATAVTTNFSALNYFSHITDTPSGSESVILSYTVPTGQRLDLDRVDVSGTNIATFNVYINGDLIARTRTGYNNLSESLDFTNDQALFEIASESVIEVKVLHEKPYAGDFDARIQGGLVT